LSIFWLEKAAFHQAHQAKTRDILARKRKTAEVEPELVAAPTSYVKTRYGREFHIAPDGNLIRVLQGYSYV
jgi:hypothetical protein